MIKLIKSSDSEAHIACAKLLEDAFPWCYAPYEIALEEVKSLTQEGLLLGFQQEGQWMGFIGAIPQYTHTGWELHPLVIDKAYRHQGIGKALVKALEDTIVKRGGITLYLGTDDEHFKTSLSQGDLYQDLFKAIQTIQNLDQHPYAFYQKLGYHIVGVIPDANGFHKPDILMAKRLIPLPKNVS